MRNNQELYIVNQPVPNFAQMSSWETTQFRGGNQINIFNTKYRSLSSELNYFQRNEKNITQIKQILTKEKKYYATLIILDFDQDTPASFFSRW